MSGQTLKILLIDDDPGDAELLRRLLNKISEFQVEFTHCLDAESGQQALAAQKTDCLLLDYRLGEHDGLEVLASIRALGDDVSYHRSYRRRQRGSGGRGDETGRTGLRGQRCRGCARS